MCVAISGTKDGKKIQRGGKSYHCQGVERRRVDTSLAQTTSTENGALSAAGTGASPSHCTLQIKSILTERLTRDLLFREIRTLVKRTQKPALGQVQGFKNQDPAYFSASSARGPHLTDSTTSQILTIFCFLL